MKNTNVFRAVSLGLAPLMLVAQSAMAAIPEPDNLLYGTVTVDGAPVTASDSNVSLVLEYQGRVIDSYTMGEDPAAQNRYVLSVPLDAIDQRRDGFLRKGDVLTVRYQMGTSRSAATEVVVDDRGTSVELNLALRGVDIINGPDPNSQDTDGDGISDVAEVAAGLNPFDPSDALLDADGDGVNNLDEYLAGRDLNADDEPPLLIPPNDIEVPATGLFTKVDFGEATAFDALDGALKATNDSRPQLAPGAHFVEWRASDKSGNVATATQLVIVKPIVNFHTDAVVAEGSNVDLVAELNGPAAIYPVSIPFTVAGTAVGGGVDHTLASGEILIQNGLRGSVNFQIIDDGDAGETLETIVVTMGASGNVVLGEKRVYTARISDENIAPTVELVAEQGQGQTRLIVASGGVVTVNALVHDPDPGDSHSYDWSFSDSQLLEMDGNSSDSQFVFDPNNLSPGFYRVAVSVSDASLAINRTDVVIAVLNEAPLLTSLDSDGDGIADDIEGYVDTDGDGIPDYLDNLEPENLIRAMAAMGDEYLIETEPGLKLSLGYTALTSKKNGAMVNVEDIALAFSLPPLKEGEASEKFPGGIFDFTVSGLAQPSDSAYVVLPQLAVIPKRAVYRKYSADTMAWNAFVENDRNAVYSAPGAEGFCPPPKTAEYKPGLTQGDWCVMLLIEDGGPNDADGLSNQSIKDPGGVQGEAVSTTGSSGGGGGGRFDLFLLLLVALSAGLMYRSRNRRIHSAW
ncbi:choice-of-anchor U domain-containing protein [Marinobacter salinus]|nr:choice-of-anchor U domain-containing protein [Marinobacter salinus]